MGGWVERGGVERETYVPIDGDAEQGLLVAVALGLEQVAGDLDCVD